MEQRSAALDAMSDAVLAIASELSVEPILEKLVHSARELVDARYAALGVPDGRGGVAGCWGGGGFCAVHHGRDERRARGQDGTAAAHARAAWGDARVRAAVSH